MGNSNVHSGFRRGGSKRYSVKKTKEKTANRENPKPVDESGTIMHPRTEEKETQNTDTCLQNLEKALSRHEDNLDRVVKETVAQKKKINGVLELLLENTTENVDDASQEEGIVRMNTVTKKAIDTLKDIQNTCQLPTMRIKESFKDVRRDIDRCREQFGKDASVIDTHHDKQVLEKLYKDTDGPRNAKRKLEEQVKSLKQKVAKLEHANRELQQHETQQPTNVSATVQIFYIHEGQVIKEIEKELKAMLNSRLGTVNFINCPNVTDIDKKKLLIAMCIVSTRLGADAARVIKNIENPENAALLVIHYTESYSLPVQTTSRHLTDKGFRNLRGIFDMSFKSGNGFFQCDMNEKSINELCSFCKQPPLAEKL